VAPASSSVAPLLAFDLWVMLATAVACFPVFVTVARSRAGGIDLPAVANAAYTMFRSSRRPATRLRGYTDTMLE